MRTQIIAEIGQAHDGSLGILHSYIDAVSKTGVDTIKFQTHIAVAESSIYEKFRVPFSFEDENRFDYWKRMELTFEQWLEIKKHCEIVGLSFLSTPFSVAAVDLLEKVKVDWYKIGSGDTNNLLLVEKIARTQKKIILSSGMSDFLEIDQAVDIINKYGNEYAILQCTTAYPTPPTNIGLNVISEIKSRYGCKTGLSYHSGEIFSGIAAVALGADIVEVHTVFDKKMFGPDASSSLSIEELAELVIGIRTIESTIKNPVRKGHIGKYNDIKKLFGRSLAINKDLDAEHVIAFDDLEVKKPSGFGICATEYSSVIGKKLKVKKFAYEFLCKEDML